MDISGSYTLKAPRERVWENLLDPDVLQKTIPGCEKLEQIGPDQWRMRVNVGIAAVKGVYEGTLQMSDQVAPEHYRMVADGTGARSVLHGEGTLSLEAPDPNTTVVNYKGEAQINGPLAGIANRVAGSVSRMMVNQFFGRFQREMDAKGFSTPALDASAAPGAAPSTDGASPTPAPTAFATTEEGTMEDTVFDASTSGVWEMSLPEARPLDGEQGPATALPLDATPAAAAATAPTASAPAATAPAASAAGAAEPPAVAATAAADAPVAATPPASAAATSAPAASATPPDTATNSTSTSGTSASSASASAAPSNSRVPSSGGFMAWLRRLLGGNG